jgi:hypothetical protein
MNLFELYQYINYICRSNPRGNTFSGDEYNRLLPIVAFKYFRKLFGIPEKYKNTDGLRNFGFETSSLNSEKIRFLKVIDTTIAADVDGQCDYPVDYFRYSNFKHETVENEGEEDEVTHTGLIIPLNEQEFESRILSKIDPPTLDDVICVFRADHIQLSPLLPMVPEGLELSYLRFPTTPVFGYAIDYITAELVYIENGAYFQVTNAGAAGQTITVVAYIVATPTTIGTYTIQTGDDVRDVMIAITNAINLNLIINNVRAIFDNEKIWLYDLLGTRGTLTINVTGAVTATKVNFSARSVQFDWETDIESMSDISEIILDMIGISEERIGISQWAEKEKAKNNM